MQPQKPVLGILGGLRYELPAANLYQMLIDHTPAARDQDHLDVVISSRASTPDRTAYILGQSDEDPFAVMEQDGKNLVRYGAHRAGDCLQHRALFLRPPCRSAARTRAEYAPPDRAGRPSRGLHQAGHLATDGTLAAETYQLACAQQGIDCAFPSAEHQTDVMSVIYDDIKQGRRADMAKFGAAVHDSKKAGLRYPAVLGCTELSLVKRDEHLALLYRQHRGAFRATPCLPAASPPSVSELYKFC